jgi:hypothetical protein
MDPKNTLVLACATVMEEMRPFMPPGLDHHVFEFGLHITPKKLRSVLQQTINEASGQYETIILGYGLCSLAITGICAPSSRLVVPRVDDCIAIFLGSRSAYHTQFSQQPGTYYLTRGWIEVGDTPFSEYQQNIKRYGKENADLVYNTMMAHYTRLALILTSETNMEPYRQFARKTAAQFGLDYEEIHGSDTLIRKLLYGPWDEEILVVEAGEMITIDPFIPSP